MMIKWRYNKEESEVYLKKQDWRKIFNKEREWVYLEHQVWNSGNKIKTLLSKSMEIDYKCFIVIKKILFKIGKSSLICEIHNIK